MDELKNYIKKFNEKCGLKVIEKLLSDLKNEEFDTESIKMDLNLENSLLNKEYDGNINVNNYGKILCKEIKKFVKEQKSYVLNKVMFLSLIIQIKRKT